jgi:hypothetical protein
VLSTFRMRHSILHTTWVRSVEKAQSAEQELAAATQRNRAAVDAFTTVLPYTDELTTQVRDVVAQLPPATHHAGWLRLMDDLDHAAEAVRDILRKDAAGNRNAALWPYLTTWASHAQIVVRLAEQPLPYPAVPQLPSAEAHDLLRMVRAELAAGTLERTESWYDITGELITLADIEANRDAVLALRGHMDSPSLTVIGFYGSTDDAQRCCPPPAPPGVLRPAASPVEPKRGATALATATEDFLEIQHCADAAEMIESVARTQGPHPGEFEETRRFLDVAGEFAAALETGEGSRIALRLQQASTELQDLTTRIAAIGEDLAGTVGVLPPHRVPRPHHVPQLTPPTSGMLAPAPLPVQPQPNRPPRSR